MRRTFLVLLSASALLSGAAAAQPVAPMDQQAPARGAGGAAQRGSGLHGRFAAMDTDGDGRITMQEFIAFQDRVFDRLDVQHKGQIDKADVDAALAQSQLRDAGGMTRGAGRRAGGGEKMLVQLSNRLAEGGEMTREMWEKRAERRFQRLDTARVGYLVPTDFHAPQRHDGSEE